MLKLCLTPYACYTPRRLLLKPHQRGILHIIGAEGICNFWSLLMSHPLRAPLGQAHGIISTSCLLRACNAMPEHFDPALLGLFTFLVFAVSLFLYLSMDIHNASKVLWSACGNIKGKVAHSQPFKRRASDSDFQLLNSAEDTSVPSTPEPRDGWNLVSDHKHNYGSADDLSGVVDCGHFSEEEFLARFGGMRSLLPLVVQARLEIHQVTAGIHA